MAALSPRPQPPLPAIRYKDTQAKAEALVSEALGEYTPKAGLTMRANAVRLLVSMWYCHGSTKFPRGWVTPAMQAFLDLGLDCPQRKGMALLSFGYSRQPRPISYNEWGPCRSSSDKWNWTSWAAPKPTFHDPKSNAGPP